MSLETIHTRLGAIGSRLHKASHDELLKIEELLGLAPKPSAPSSDAGANEPSASDAGSTPAAEPTV